MSVFVSGWTILIILMIIGGYEGWRRGIRAFITITAVSGIAYLLLISGGRQILAYINNIYSHIPMLLAVLLGNNATQAGLWNPIINTDFQFPFLVRVVLFLMLAVGGWLVNTRTQWYKPGPKDQASRWLGIFAGALTALIWVSAISAFWQEANANRGFQGGVGSVISILPDVTAILPWLIAILFLIIVVGIVRNLPKLLTP